MGTSHSISEIQDHIDELKYKVNTFDGTINTKQYIKLQKELINTSSSILKVRSRKTKSTEDCEHWDQMLNELNECLQNLTAKASIKRASTVEQYDKILPQRRPKRDAIATINHYEKEIKKLDQEVQTAIQSKDFQKRALVEGKLKIFFTDLAIINTEGRNSLEIQKNQLLQKLLDYYRHVRKDSADITAWLDLAAEMTKKRIGERKTVSDFDSDFYSDFDSEFGGSSRASARQTSTEGEFKFLEELKNNIATRRVSGFVESEDEEEEIYDYLEPPRFSGQNLMLNSSMYAKNSANQCTTSGNVQAKQPPPRPPKPQSFKITNKLPQKKQALHQDIKREESEDEDLIYDYVEQPNFHLQNTKFQEQSERPPKPKKMQNIKPSGPKQSTLPHNKIESLYNTLIQIKDEIELFSGVYRDPKYLNIENQIRICSEKLAILDDEDPELIINKKQYTCYVEQLLEYLDDATNCYDQIEYTTTDIQGTNLAKTGPPVPPKPYKTILERQSSEKIITPNIEIFKTQLKIEHITASDSEEGAEQVSCDDDSEFETDTRQPLSVLPDHHKSIKDSDLREIKNFALKDVAPPNCKLDNETISDSESLCEQISIHSSASDLNLDESLNSTTKEMRSSLEIFLETLPSPSDEVLGSDFCKYIHKKRVFDVVNQGLLSKQQNLQIGNANDLIIQLASESDEETSNQIFVPDSESKVVSAEDTQKIKQVLDDIKELKTLHEHFKQTQNYAIYTEINEKLMKTIKSNFSINRAHLDEQSLALLETASQNITTFVNEM